MTLEPDLLAQDAHNVAVGHGGVDEGTFRTRECLEGLGRVIRRFLRESMAHCNDQKGFTDIPGDKTLFIRVLWQISKKIQSFLQYHNITTVVSGYGPT